MALKWVFLAVALGLFTSTLIGLWLAFTASRNRRLILALFAVGTLAPIALLVLQP